MTRWNHVLHTKQQYECQSSAPVFIKTHAWTLMINSLTVDLESLLCDLYLWIQGIIYILTYVTLKLTELHDTISSYEFSHYVTTITGGPFFGKCWPAPSLWTFDSPPVNVDPPLHIEHLTLCHSSPIAFRSNHAWNII